MAPNKEFGQDDHRVDREAGSIVYQAFSRRSGGLSLGINLFPDRKLCNFDCPYCEVFPFRNPERFSLDALEARLLDFLDLAYRLGAGGPRIRDICFSGCGEPTMSPFFADALALVDQIRSRSQFPGLPIVVITNGTGFLDQKIFTCISSFAVSRTVIPWVKLDAGTESWYRKISRSPVPFRDLCNSIRDYFLAAPGVIQTMLCSVNGILPDGGEIDAWIDFVQAMIFSGGMVREIHLYTKSRPAPESITEPVPMHRLLAIAELVRSRIGSVPVKTFGV